MFIFFFQIVKLMPSPSADSKFVLNILKFFENAQFFMYTQRFYYINWPIWGYLSDTQNKFWVSRWTRHEFSVLMHSPYLILSQYLNPRSYSKLLKNAPPLTLITFLIRCIKIKMHPQKYFNHMLMIINWTIWWYHDIPDLIVPYFHSRFKVSWLMNMITHSIIMQSGNVKNGL